MHLVSALVLVCSATPTARADDTWHNIYHSLKRFFTGSSSSSPSPGHRAKRSANHLRTNQSTETSSTAPDRSPDSGASPTPRVVILPAASPVASDQAKVNPPAKPEVSPSMTPVLLSLPQPTPSAGPKVMPSVAPGTGNPTSNKANGSD
jgi:hypothetical protein